jgi:hypothetical protein
MTARQRGQTQKVERFDATPVALQALPDDRKRSDSDDGLDFRPAPEMLAYLLHYRHLMAAGLPFSQRAVANESYVHEDVVSRWCRVPGFGRMRRRGVNLSPRLASL